MSQCPHCRRTIGFKQPADLCGTCEARAVSEYTSIQLQNQSALFSDCAFYYRDYFRYAAAIECQRSSAEYAKLARQRMGIES